jgi:two-component system sensor histidine kinase FlrB
LNAVQAAEAGGEVVIQASVQTAGADLRNQSIDFATPTLTLTVTDSGPGIPAEAQQRVFEPFYSTKSRGTGLGLAIVQRRAVELGGSVELSSPVQDGHGARFQVVIPLAPIASKVG